MKHIYFIVKYLLFPGMDFGTRARRKLVRYFRAGDFKTLDAGCGNGAFSLAAYKLGNQVLGINIDADQVRRCVEYAGYVGADAERIKFQLLNIYDLKSLHETFEQIICFEALEHLQRDQEVVQIFADCLSPGGLLHLCTPNSACTFQAEKGISETEDGGHVRVGYTHEELERLMQEAGLTPIIKDIVGGFGRIKATAMQDWLGDRIWSKLPKVLAVPAQIMAFFVLAPLTLLDGIVSYPSWSVYVCGKK